MAESREGQDNLFGKHPAKQFLIRIRDWGVVLGSSLALAIYKLEDSVNIHFLIAFPAAIHKVGKLLITAANPSISYFYLTEGASLYYLL